MAETIQNMEEGLTGLILTKPADVMAEDVIGLVTKEQLKPFKRCARYISDNEIIIIPKAYAKGKTYKNLKFQVLKYTGESLDDAGTVIFDSFKISTKDE